MTEALKYLKIFMDQNKYNQSDLSAVLGSRSRASEVLSGKRGISISMIRKIKSKWTVNVRELIRQ